jgi:hypothetical protein
MTPKPLGSFSKVLRVTVKINSGTLRYATISLAPGVLLLDDTFNTHQLNSNRTLNYNNLLLDDPAPTIESI